MTYVPKTGIEYLGAMLMVGGLGIAAGGFIGFSYGWLPAFLLFVFVSALGGLVIGFAGMIRVVGDLPND